MGGAAGAGLRRLTVTRAAHPALETSTATHAR